MRSYRKCGKRSVISIDSHRFLRVMMMEQLPTSLFRPPIAWRVLKPTGSSVSRTQRRA
ncbi:hypothetical protein NKF26_22010 [Haladaptatus sp. AB618]|uniref:hypothetical protein n=1 Tax=Haladaptatus sp. AB618 TaxID=2934173 RepID=UPI00209BE961|nr:hypothetical protein [Haladaptatus sp. AB618]MCO8256495.1 hypothetical protein [Haladaptatus sp. AB618]